MQQSLGSSTREAHIRHAIESFRRQGQHAKADQLEDEITPAVSEPPAEAEHIWEVFLEITSSRRISDGVPTTSISQELDLWQRLYALQFLPWELRALRMLDGIWCNWVLKQATKKPNA